MEGQDMKKGQVFNSFLCLSDLIVITDKQHSYLCLCFGFHMASSSHNSMKIHEQCLVAPTSASATATTSLSLPLTQYDLVWLRFHPNGRIFFYSLSLSHADPCYFFEKVVPKLKTSLSHTLQHFLPLAGNILWPSDSPKPIIQFNPGDGVSLVLAQCDEDSSFNHMLDNSPREATECRTFVPHLDSSDSFASVISLQITLFPNKGFCIGISTHHAVLDGKSSTMFIKAWAHACNKLGEDQAAPVPVPSLVPLFDRELVKDPTGLESVLINNLAQMDPSNASNGRSLKILAPPIEKDRVRATFELTQGDLEKIKKMVLSKWREEPRKPTTLSSFVTCFAYVSVCIVKAFDEAQIKQKFCLGFPFDCRARLDPPIPENYFGNLIACRLVNAEQDDFMKEDGVAIVAKKIWSEVQMLNHEGALNAVETMLLSTFKAINSSEGVKVIGVAGSSRFGLYNGADFGWGRPAKAAITSIDRRLSMALAESKDGKGGVEVGLVLNKRVMDLFHANFHAGLLCREIKKF